MGGPADSEPAGSALTVQSEGSSRHPPARTRAAPRQRRPPRQGPVPGASALATTQILRKRCFRWVSAQLPPHSAASPPRDRASGLPHPRRDQPGAREPWAPPHPCFPCPSEEAVSHGFPAELVGFPSPLRSPHFVGLDPVRPLSRKFDSILYHMLVSPSWCGSGGWNIIPRAEGGGSSSQSGHMPWSRVRSLVGAHVRRSMFLSPPLPSLLPCPSLALKSNEKKK